MENFFQLNQCKLKLDYEIVDMCQGIDIKTKTRLYELGFLPGEKLKILSTSLNKGVLLIQIRGSVLTLRTNEASCVIVK